MSDYQKKKHRREILIALAFLLPNFIGFLVFMAGPVVFSLGASFTNWNLQQTVPFQFIWFDNFIDLLTDHEFWLYFINTVYLMLGMPIAIAGSLGLALLLNMKLRGMSVYRTLYYLPSITTGVALIILWKALYNPEVGPINVVINWLIEISHINDLITALGGDGIQAPYWLNSTRNIFALKVETVGFDLSQWGLGARDAIIFMGVWTVMGGGNMILYLAALSNVPSELLEAARIDGAGKWKTFRHVTWPMLAPTTFFIVVMSFIAGLQGGFEQARVMTLGGPAGTTTTLTYYIYTKAFEQFEIGYSSAIAWILFVIIFVVTMINWKFGNRDLTD